MKRGTLELLGRAVIAVSLLLALASAALAADQDGKKAASSSIKEVGVFLQAFDYKENIPAPLKSTEEGIVLGVRGSVEGNPIEDSGFWGRIGADIAAGNTDHDGTDMTGTISFTNTTRNLFYGLEADAGYTFRREDGREIVTPYIGAALHVWLRRLGDSGEVLGYDETYSWAHLPIGLRTHLDIDERYALALDLSYRAWIGGTIQVDLSDVGGPDLDLTLGREDGWRLEGSIARKAGGVVVTVWYEEYGFGKSNIDADTGAYEPASTSKQAGVGVGIGF